jgi:hypothetical protein
MNQCTEAFVTQTLDVLAGDLLLMKAASRVSWSMLEDCVRREECVIFLLRGEHNHVRVWLERRE